MPGSLTSLRIMQIPTLTEKFFKELYSVPLPPPGSGLGRVNQGAGAFKVSGKIFFPECNHLWFMEHMGTQSVQHSPVVCHGCQSNHPQVDHKPGEGFRLGEPGNHIWIDTKVGQGHLISSSQEGKDFGKSVTAEKRAVRKDRKRLLTSVSMGKSSGISDCFPANYVQRQTTVAGGKK
jgi:hypothetical protein